MKSQKNLLKIDGTYYAFNLKKICNFVHEIGGKEMKESEIIDTYDFTDPNPNKVAAKTVRELTTPGGNQDTITYDLLKIFVIQVIAYDGEGDFDLEDLPFGTKLAFNTLITEGFLYEI